MNDCGREWAEKTMSTPERSGKCASPSSIFLRKGGDIERVGVEPVDVRYFEGSSRSGQHPLQLVDAGAGGGAGVVGVEGEGNDPSTPGLSGGGKGVQG